MKIDSYTWYARVLPVYLTIFPVAMVIAALPLRGLNLPISAIVSFVFVPLAYFGGELGSDRGKKRERGLWSKWGGPPTTRFLRHSNDEFNHVTRQRVHEKLRTLGLHVPSPEEEQRPSADDYYASCTDELIRRTRDSSRFPLVFKGLTQYGFRRNLFGLKPIALPISFISLAICAGSAVLTWQSEDPSAIPIIATAISLGLLLSWLFWVKEEIVHVAANRYARFLLEATLEQE